MAAVTSQTLTRGAADHRAHSSTVLATDALPIPLLYAAIVDGDLILAASNHAGAALLKTETTVGEPVPGERVFAKTALADLRRAVERAIRQGAQVSLACDLRFGGRLEPCLLSIGRADQNQAVLAVITSDTGPNLVSGRDTLAAISHELRTPLNSIIGFAEMMSEELVGPLGSPQYREYAKLIGNAGRNILDRFNSETERERLTAIRHQDDYEQIIELAPDMICICVDGRIKRINAAGIAMLGMWDADTIVGRCFSDFVPDDYRDVLAGDMQILVDEKAAAPVRLRRGDGLILDVEINVLPFDPRDEHGKSEQAVILAARDVTERQRSVRTILEREERLRSTMDTVHDAIIVIDETAAIESANAAAVRIFGHALSELVGAKLEAILDRSATEYNNAEALAHLISQREDNGQHAQFETIGRRKSGETFPLEMTVNAMIFGGRQLIIGSFRDISVRKSYEKKLTRLATRDPLSDLPNRFLFEKELDEAIRRVEDHGERLTVMSCDLNAFKSINDALGHVIGDKVLIAAARRIEEIIGDSGYLSHFGGDDFFALFRVGVSSEEIERTAETICQEMAKPLHVEGKEIFSSCTIGICHYPDDANNRIELMQRAETVTHYAKKYFAGSYAFYTQPLSEQAARRLDIEHNLRRAIEREEFSLLFQPKVDLANQRIIGAEALIRWNSRKLGFVPPDEFIEVAEQTGLIIDIGQWVLDNVCNNGAAWIRDGLPPIQFGVNLSAIQFLQGDLDTRIKQALVDSGFEPRLLDLELTESMLVENPERTIDTLLELKKMGITVSMDDFGTGYSALSYLTRFPLDTLKVDRAFVTNLPQDRDAATIARTIVSMAQNLNFAVVAEGIETESQMMFLSALGCDIGQGYLFGKPMERRELSALATAA